MLLRRYHDVKVEEKETEVVEKTKATPVKEQAKQTASRKNTTTKQGDK